QLNETDPAAALRECRNAGRSYPDPVFKKIEESLVNRVFQDERNRAQELMNRGQVQTACRIQGELLRLHPDDQCVCLDALRSHVKLKRYRAARDCARAAMVRARDERDIDLYRSILQALDNPDASDSILNRLPSAGFFIAFPPAPSFALAPQTLRSLPRKSPRIVSAEQPSQPHPDDVDFG